MVPRISIFPLYPFTKSSWRNFVLFQGILYYLKETRNSFINGPLNLWWILNKTIIEIEIITKATTFKSFLHRSYKNTQLLSFVAVLFNIFMRQTLTDGFWGLHKNMNCAFPLREAAYEKYSLLHEGIFARFT